MYVQLSISLFSVFKCLGCILDETGTDVAECRRKVAALFIPFLLYASETMIWREKKKSRIRAVQMDSFRGLLGIRRIAD